MSRFSSGRAHDNRLRGQARAVNVLISEKMVLDARVGNIVCFENKATFFCYYTSKYCIRLSAQEINLTLVEVLMIPRPPNARRILPLIHFNHTHIGVQLCLVAWFPWIVHRW